VIGIVVVGHGELAQATVRTAEGIVGSQRALMAVGSEPEDGLGDLQDKIERAIQRVGGDEGVLVLTDMLGGSPALASLQAARTHRIEVVVGLNLPMVLESLLHRESMGLEKLAEFVVRKARKGISRPTASWGRIVT